MSKPVINNRIVYNNLLGRIAQHDIFVNQGVSTGDSPTFQDIFIMGDASITGNLYVEGNTTIFNTNVLEFEDNIILINRAETGNGVTLNQAGLEIDRGSAENYRIIFHESDDTTRIGPISNTQALATREDSPLSNGVMTWNNSQKRLDSTNSINIDLSLTSTTNSINTSSGALKLSGGLGVIGNIYTGGKLDIRNNTISTNTSNNILSISSTAGINLLPTSNVFIPADKPLILGSENNSFVVNSTSGNIEISANNDINFSLGFGKKLTIPNGIPITFSTQNEKIYTDNSNNMVVEGSQDINLIPGVNKKVFLNFDTPISFGNSNQKIYGTLIEDLYIQSGNNIVLSPSGIQNVIIPTDNGIKFGNSGTQRIYSDSNNQLFISSSNDLTISVSSGNINISSSNRINFNGTTGSIYAENTNNTLFLNAQTIRISNTTESTTSNSGALVVNGGAGINKNLNVGGDVVITGNLTVSGISTTLNTETILLEDNMIVVNNGPSPLFDSGFLVKKFQTGTSGSTNYAGLFYKQSENNFVFATTSSDPGQTNVVIDNYIPIKASNLSLVSSENASGLGTGGTLTINGGASIEKKLYVGGDVYLPRENNLFFQNNNNDSSFLNMSNSGVLNIVNSNGDIQFTSVSGSFSFWNNQSNLLNIDQNGNTRLNATSNSLGLGSGGALTLSGGMSISKDLYIGGKSILSDTTPSINSSTASLLLSGGLGILCDVNSTYGNGGALTVSGGLYIEKDLYISGNIFSNNSVNELYSLTLTSTQPAYAFSGSFINNGGILILNTNNASSLTDGGSLLSYGGGTFNKDLIIGGDLNLSGSARLPGGASFLSINNTSNSHLWTFIGKLDDNSNDFYNFKISNFDLETTFQLNIKDSIPNFSYMLNGNLNTTNKTDLYIYKETLPGNNIYHIFTKTPANSFSNITIFNSSDDNILPIPSGTSVTPNGTELWSEFWSNKNIETTKDLSIGDLKVEGDFITNDNLPIIGFQNTNSNKINARDLGIMLQRYQESNDSGSGDVVTDQVITTDVLPSQSTANSEQIILSSLTETIDNYYLGWWIKTVDNQIRKIVGYTGALHVAQIDKPWTTQPEENDTVSLYNSQFPSLYWDETSKHFTFAFGVKNSDSNTILNNGEIGIKCKNLYLTGTDSSNNASTGNIYSLGGISISNSTNATDCSNGGSFTSLGGLSIQKDAFIGDKLFLGSESTIANHSLTISHINSSIAMWNTQGGHSYMYFGGDKSSNYGNSIVKDDVSELFYITYSDNINGNPLSSLKSLVINNAGNIGLKTTENLNSLLTLKGGNFIACDTDQNFLGLRGSLNETAGSRIVLYGNDSTNNEGDVSVFSGNNGTLRFYTENLERVNINSQGNVNISTSTHSINSSSGCLTLAGGLSIYSSTNATSVTNGGSITTDGGMGVKGDVYIGGDIYINGEINTTNGVLAPVITISDTQNCTISAIENSSLIKINDEILFTVSIVLTPIESSSLTEFQFELPQRTTNFIKLNQVNIQCSGFTGDEITLFNLTGVCVIDSTKCKIKLQSASTGPHYIQIMSRYKK